MNSGLVGNGWSMSAMHTIATKFCGAAIVRFVPIATDAPQQMTFLFDHLVGKCKQRWRHGEAECFRCFEVDYEFKRGRRLDRKIAGFLTP
jgi:hypothetical protein